MIKYETKRSSVRYNVNFDAYYSVKKHNKESAWNRCRVIDLSTGGVALAISNLLMVGDTLKVKLLSEDDEIVQNGIITNVNGNRVGIKFHNINTMEKKNLSFIIHKDYIGLSR